VTSRGLVPAGISPAVVALTHAFYSWEVRGRGWSVFDYPVALEPPFRPFRPPRALVTGTIDDGRKPTLLSSLAERIGAFFSNTSASLPALIESEAWDEPDPELFDSDEPLRHLVVAVPEALKIDKDIAERFLLSLSLARTPIAFELVGHGNAVIPQFSCRASDRHLVLENLRAYFPDASIFEKEDVIGGAYDPEQTALAIEFGLANEFMLPLNTPASFAIDPLIPVASALSALAADELGCLQVVFQPVRAPWAESILWSVSDGAGGSFFADAPEMTGLARRKVGKPLFAALIRLFIQAESERRAWSIARALGGAFHQFALPGSNELFPLENRGYPDAEHIVDVLTRSTRRSGMIINSEELAALVHLPGASVRVPGLLRELKKTKALPEEAIGHALILGTSVHQGERQRVTLSTESRLRHTHIVGATGTGKSNLILDLIRQDIELGHGLAVLDPHGDLVDAVLCHVPERRHHDVVLINPADVEYPVGFNVLEARSDIEKNMLASDLGSIFRRLATSWGDQMTAVLGNSILAFLESPEGGTLLDLRRFLVDDGFRRSYLRTVNDPEVVFFFEKEFPLLGGGRSVGSLLTRLDAFLRPKFIRQMVAVRRSRVDLQHVMQEGKILLCKLAQGTIGEENSFLLGSLLVSKLHHMALARQSERERRPFLLYIDEFQHFITPSMASILSGARKFGLGLILVHQDLRQLDRSGEVASAVLTNAHTRIAFRVSAEDARKLEAGFSSFDAGDLESLGLGEAICRTGNRQNDFRLKTQPVPEIDCDLAQRRQHAITELSRTSYASRPEETNATPRRAQPSTAPAGDPDTKVSPTPLDMPANPIPPATAVTPPTELASEPRSGATRRRAERLGVQRPPPPMMGRGGSEHKYLQHLIKRLGEERGYRATIEHVLSSGGRVDVALQKGEIWIACEISITTDAQHEAENIRKCLAADFTHVAMISSEHRHLRAIEIALGDIGKSAARITFVRPDDLVEFLSQFETMPPKVETVRGYKVKVTRTVLKPEDVESRRAAVAQVIARSLGKQSK
jgi:hypothetical protein